MTTLSGGGLGQGSSQLSLRTLLSSLGRCCFLAHDQSDVLLLHSSASFLCGWQSDDVVGRRIVLTAVASLITSCAPSAVLTMKQSIICWWAARSLANFGHALCHRLVFLNVFRPVILLWRYSGCISVSWCRQFAVKVWTPV